MLTEGDLGHLELGGLLVCRFVLSNSDGENKARGGPMAMLHC